MSTTYHDTPISNTLCTREANIDSYLQVDDTLLLFQQFECFLTPVDHVDHYHLTIMSG